MTKVRLPAPPMPSAGPAPQELLALRLLRGIVHVALAVIVVFLVSLVVLALVPALREAFTHTLLQNEVEKASPVIVGAFVLGAISLAGALVWYGRRLSWRMLALGGVAVAPVLAYLAMDSPQLSRPIKLEEFSPAFPGAEVSYQVLMRYGKQHPGGRDFVGSKLTWVAYEAEKPDAWIQFVTANRSVIEAEWQKLGPVREWWTELNAFDRLGDLTPAHPNGEIIAFAPVRMLSQRACAIATLQMLDGRGDEALATLLPLIEVARKLQPSARTLIHYMMAIAIERMTLQTVGFVLDRATVSPSARARLAAVLARPGGGEAGARRLMLVEYVFSSNFYLARSLGDCLATMVDLSWLRHPLNYLSPFVYNPRATFNLYAQVATDEEEIVARRELEKLGPRLQRFVEVDARPGFKNLAGAILLWQVIPMHQKVATAYWKAQDDRAALLARVQAP